MNINDYMSELDNELKSNVDKYNKMKKLPILFGESIQFEHLKSQKFLSFQPEETISGIHDSFSFILIFFFFAKKKYK